MTTIAVQVAQNVTALGFVALGIATAIEWNKRRGRAEAMLCLSLVSLAGVAVLGRWQALEGASAAVGVTTLVLFELSGYFVLLFRDSFLPLRRSTLRVATAALVVSWAAGIALTTVLVGAGRPVTTALSLFVVVIWAAFVGEPVVRFWVASSNAPSVQKARMRALSFGFSALIVILIVSVLGGSALQSPAAILVTQLVALAIVPIIYASFAPPAILRRIWRMGEEDKLRAAIRDLLIFSPGPQALAEQAVGWAERMLGAQAAFIVGSAGRIIASHGIDDELVYDIVRREAAARDGTAAASHRQTVLVVPLGLSDGPGYLGVVGGPFTPLFGTDEVSQLAAYASSVTAGLERTRVTERIATIEKHKSQFLNLASHELRGPLTVIRGYASMLESGLLGELNERGRKAAPVMVTKILEMNALIEQMIEAARLEDGALIIKPQEADLRDIAKAAVEGVQPVLDDSHSVVLNVPNRPVRVSVDAERIQTIVTNLIDNAIKYSPAGGEVTCAVTLRGGVAKVSVKDRGLGIAKEDLAILFTRFGRVTNAGTDHLPGTGLGLYLGRQLARLHGGEITVDSEPGEGSTFTLHLPSQDRVPTPPAVRQSPATAPATGRRALT